MAQWLWTQKQDIGPGPTETATPWLTIVSTNLYCSSGAKRAGGYRNDTWTWDGQAWTQVADTGPTPRRLHAMAFDSARQRTVLFGGDVGGITNDTWEWDGGVWT